MLINEHRGIVKYPSTTGATIIPISNRRQKNTKLTPRAKKSNITVLFHLSKYLPELHKYALGELKALHMCK